MLELKARVIAFSPSFKKGTEVIPYPKLTLRVGSEIVEMGVRGVENEVCEKAVDTDVTLSCEVYASKTKGAALRVLALKSSK